MTKSAAPRTLPDLLQTCKACDGQRSALSIRHWDYLTCFDCDGVGKMPTEDGSAILELLAWGPRMTAKTAAKGEAGAWKWFGHAGHLIVAQWCRFHLCTQVGDFLVSTVGEYVPDANVREIFAESRGVKLEGRGDARLHDYLNKIGFEEIGCDRKYETMVFAAGEPCAVPECGCGIPAISGHEIDFEGYNAPAAATKGHMAMCEKFATIKAEAIHG